MMNEVHKIQEALYYSLIDGMANLERAAIEAGKSRALREFCTNEDVCKECAVIARKQLEVHKIQKAQYNCACKKGAVKFSHWCHRKPVFVCSNCRRTWTDGYDGGGIHEVVVVGQTRGPLL